MIQKKPTSHLRPAGECRSQNSQPPPGLCFLDVVMPGMDGFTACAKIHETTANSHTPVVFVTSNNEMDARNQAEAAGGCGFIPKPVLSSEITLTALTFILRARLEHFKNPERTQHVAQSAC